MIKINLAFSVRRNLFLFFSALPVTLMRNQMQYDYFIGDQGLYFLGIWLVHYIFLVFLAGISLHFINSWSRLFFDESEKLSISVDQILYIVSCIAVTASIFVFIISNWPHSDPFY